MHLFINLFIYLFPCVLPPDVFHTSAFLPLHFCLVPSPFHLLFYLLVIQLLFQIFAFHLPSLPAFSLIVLPYSLFLSTNYFFISLFFFSPTPSIAFFFTFTCSSFPAFSFFPSQSGNVQYIVLHTITCLAVYFSVTSL